MRSTKKLIEDLAKLNELAGINGDTFLIPGYGGLSSRLVNYAKCELERRISEASEQHPSPERIAETQFSELLPHIRLPIQEMEQDLIALHAQRVSEYRKSSEEYLIFKCPASELSGALGGLTGARIKLKRFAVLKEEYTAANGASREATLDYKKNKIGLAVLYDVRERLSKVVTELESICHGA